MSVKINKLEIENVKRVNAVTMEPAENGLTIIGGDNSQGKTSVLDSIAWVLGGNKYKPSSPKHEGSESDPYLSITMNNGLKVERKGKNSSLVVTDPSGMKGGQQLLDKFVEELALDLPKFMQESSAEKAKTLLNIIGVGPKLAELDAKEKKAFDDRTFTKRTLDQAENLAIGLEFFPDAPEENQSVAELVARRDDILKHNESNSKKRDSVITMENAKKSAEESIRKLEEQISELNKRKEELYKSLDDIIVKLDRTKKESELFKDLSTDEIDSQIKNIDEVNYKVNANRNKCAAEAEAKKYKEQHLALSKEIENIRKQKKELLNGATQTVCAICGKPVDFSLKYPDPWSATVDHIIPIDRGGHPSDISNLQLAHFRCNRLKSDRVIPEKNNTSHVEVISNRMLPLSCDWTRYAGT